MKYLECRTSEKCSFLHSVLRQGSIVIKIKTKTKRLEIFHVLCDKSRKGEHAF